jgi:TnpA family transposase
MQTWQAVFLGARELSREISAFELEAFFTFSGAERQLIEQRRDPSLKLGLALQMGFLRMSGRLLNALRIVPGNLWRHLGAQFNVAAPDLASLRALYRRGNTLFEQQQLACQALGFGWMNEHQRRYLVSMLREELERTIDRDRLLLFARRWLYEHQLIIVHDRMLRKMIAASAQQFETELAASIQASVSQALLERWRESLTGEHGSGLTVQTWLWAAPAKHSTRRIEEVLDRIKLLYSLDVQNHLIAIPAAQLRRYAKRLASRAPAAGARIKEPGRTIEVACFLRYCLLSATDHLILMVRRRVADLWRHARASADESATNWAKLYQQLLADLGRLVADQQITDTQARQRLAELVALNEQRRPPSKSQIARDRLIEAIRPVRGLLRELVKQPWQASGEHPVAEAMTALRDLYERQARVLPDGISPGLGSVWRDAFTGFDRERAFRALEVSTLLGLRRALRNGSVWIEHSLGFRSREQLFIPEKRWANESHRYYSRLSLPSSAAQFLAPVLEHLKSGLQAVATAADAGKLRIDDDLHLKALEAEDEDPQVVTLRAALNHRIGEAQLPELILDIDAQVRFSWIMLGREPRSSDELLMVYAGILAHGTALSAAECARMIPQLSASSIRQAMRWAADERRLAEACSAVLEFMHRHPIAATWGRDDLASSDMMSMETSKRVWQARIDPRRQTPSVGIYTHVRDRWGIFYAQPIVLNERQAGAAIEGVVRQERIETTQLAVDTHGYTDFAMMLARLLGFDLCPRLKALKQRQLYVPRGTDIPEAIKPICIANADIELIQSHWDQLVHLTASVHTGHASAVTALGRFGSAARGDPIYAAGVQLGRLLRTVFLADYFVNDAFRRELLRVLNRGEAVNALKRAIYTGRVAGYQAKREDEMQAVADALSLLANIVMAWNTTQLQAIIDRWNHRRRERIAAELIGRIAPTRIEGINLRGVFRFPIERFATQILPSASEAKIAVSVR